MSKKTRIGAALAVLMIGGFGLAACNSEPAKQETPEAAVSVQAPRNFYRAASFQDAVVQASGDVFSVQRTGEGRQGLSLLPYEGEGPVRIDFSVAGAGATVSAYRGGEWIVLPAQEAYAVRLGNGGAFHILVVPGPGSTATVTVSGTTTCRGAPEETCPPLPGAQ